MAQETSNEHHELGHVVSLKVLFGVLGTLLFLTFITVAVTNFDFGPFNLIVAMLVATLKGSLVLLYFMHLRWDKPFNAVVFISALAFVALFIVLALLDTFEYREQLIPGYAPAIDRR